MTTKIYIVYYSMYGHIKKMADSMKKGVDSVPGCEGVLYQVPETLSDEVLEKMHAPPKDDSVPIITANDLPNADGIIFGIPTRFGMACAQMKAFMDSTGGLWGQGKLMGKVGDIFFIRFYTHMFLHYGISTLIWIKNFFCFYSQLVSLYQLHPSVSGALSLFLSSFTATG